MTPIRIALLVLLAVALIWGAIGLFNYFRQRRAQGRAEREGLVLYADVLSTELIGGLLKSLNIHKIRMRLTEPGKSPREVTLRTRLMPGQKFGKQQRLMVIVDPVSPERVYPATEEAAKRITLTGTRTERKLMEAQMRNPRRFSQRPPSTYQPPINKIR